MHESCPTANECFVNFDFARQLAALLLTLHSEPNPVEHKPCRLLGDVERTVKFPRANSIPVAGNHPQCRKPLLKAKRGVLENGSKLHAELRLGMPCLALKHTARCDEADILGAARRASDAVRPAAGNKKLQAVVGIGEVDNRFLEGLWFMCLRVHQPTVSAKV